ncbi:hypothetical protein FH972_010060 [Carpinus fangiana]|uniref:Histidine-containing phosphotransfer protein n=1 Tax=Carpinus fangiana TaxID=176857 RepID=A0A660KM50_9ROSI|nr:hypothetical protein FH972_010060 [Carpinus fangiana]
MGSAALAAKAGRNRRFGNMTTMKMTTINTAATLDLIQHYPLNFPFSHSDKCSIYIYIITWRVKAFQLTIKRELLSFSLRFSFFSLSQRKKMAGADNLRAQLNNYIKDMHDQGILDKHFEHVTTLQNEYNPYFVLEIVSIFCRDAENGIAEVKKFLDEPVVDYVKAIDYVHQLRGGSSSLGGNRMAIACHELRQATQNNKKEECLQALEKVKREFNTLREKLDLISQMERTILTNEGRMVQYC